MDTQGLSLNELIELKKKEEEQKVAENANTEVEQKMPTDTLVNEQNLQPQEGAINDPNLPQSNISSLANFMNEIDEEVKTYENIMGPVETLQERAIKAQQNAIEGQNLDVKKSTFNDTVIEEEEAPQETHEEKEEETTGPKPPINLGSIRIKKTKDSTKAYDAVKRKRQKDEAISQVVLQNSCYTAALAGFSSPELRTIAKNISAMDEYRAADYKYRKIHSKLRETSIGDMDYNTFLKVTSLLELNTIYFGLFDSTYPDKNSFPAECEDQDCKAKFDFVYPNAKLFYLQDEKREEATKKILEVIKGVKNPKQVLENSEVNNLERLYLDFSGTIVELRHPSLYNQLHDVLENVTDDMIRLHETAVNLMPFIENIYVLEDPNDVESEYILLDNFEDKLNELDSLKEEDDLKLAKAISAIIDKYNTKFGFRDVICPVCKKPLADINIDSMEQLLFMTHRIKTTE